MPLYTFVNDATGEVTEEFVKMAELDDYLEQHPELRLQLSAPGTISGIAKKPSTDLNSKLKILKKFYGEKSTINHY